MRYLHVALLILISLGLHGQATTNLANIKSGTIYSEILKMDKSYQVFLPESYNYSDNVAYPVVYIIDGDYNFYYQTGIIESLANVSEQIPELIVVGISDNGNEGYRKDCTLKTVKNPAGNAEVFLNYIEKELKPAIESKFKVSDYEVLIGHSLGGLFATNVFIQQPELFSAYLAIDPSLWWEENHSSSLADSLFKTRKEIASKFIITLADTKQMGVHEFVGVMEKYFPASKNWTFKYYEKETHGSVGILSVRDGLLKIFEDWELKREQFYGFETSMDVVNYYKKLSEQYHSTLRIPPLMFSNIIYYYFRKEQMDELAILEKEVIANFPSSIDDYYAKLGMYLLEKEQYDESKKILEKSIATNKKAYKSYDVLSKLNYATKDFETARKYSAKSIEIAKDLMVRQWQLNELASNLKKIQVKIAEK